MIKKTGFYISQVAAGSPAEKAGIKAGFRLLRVDSQKIGDIIDFKIAESDTRLRLLVMTGQGYLRRIKIKKQAAAPLGLQFDPPTMDPIKRCQNRCIFCFIDQNPPGLRTPLYIKDDDYRLSFLYGNFITLNRLSDKEITRIKRLQLSPLYVSVQTTNPVLRRAMFNSKMAGRGLANLKKLVGAGIGIHAQIVLCPGFNTGAEMEKTIKDLYNLGENILSVALVPVGLTSHRDGLPGLQKFADMEAERLIKQVSVMQNDFLKQRGSRFVFLADEFYNLAGFPLPSEDEYENYPQLENGVGIARQFLEQLKDLSLAGMNILPRKITVTILSGLAAKPQIQEMTDIFKQITGLTVQTVFAHNHYFGEKVTVSGLLAGKDLIEAMEGKEVGDVVFIPDIMLKDNSDLFLDDLNLKDLEEAFQAPVRAVNSPQQIIDVLLKFSDSSETGHKKGNK